MTLWEQFLAIVKLIPGFVAEGIRDFDRRLREATKSLADRQAEENRLAALGETSPETIRLDLDAPPYPVTDDQIREAITARRASTSRRAVDDARHVDGGYARCPRCGRSTGLGMEISATSVVSCCNRCGWSEHAQRDV